MHILVIDNYDSFTYNLVHLLNAIGHEAIVWRNDQFSMADVAVFDKIILSPGPGIPSEAGLLLDVIQAYSSSKNILGICLGMQAIAEVFGGKLYQLAQPVHGRALPIKILDRADPLFVDCPTEFNVGRYHSWAVSERLPSQLKMTAIGSDGVVMALRHDEKNVTGLQFHPESILTAYGSQIIANWCHP